MAKKKKSKPAKKKATPKTKAVSKKRTALAKNAAPKKKAKPRGAARPAAAGGPPPYKCQTTLEPGVCLRFNRNPATGQYNLPPGGTRVNCSDCEYFFD